jgi:hypothetical protein
MRRFGKRGMNMIAIIYTASAAMPSSCKGTYRNVHVIAVNYWNAWNPNFRPSSIRGKDVLRVIRSWGPCNVGKTERCSYQQALARAREVCRDWNSARTMAEAEQIIGAGGSA